MIWLHVKGVNSKTMLPTTEVEEAISGPEAKTDLFYNFTLEK